MIKCNICECEFKPTIKKHYISRDEGKIGLAVAFQANPETKIYDTFDCPECGCQVIAQGRKRAFISTCDDCDEEEVNEDA